jgi:hypothetical protein
VNDATYPPPPPTTTTSVPPPTTPTALTGGNTEMQMTWIGVLLVVGVVATMIARWRAKRFEQG